MITTADPRVTLLCLSLWHEPGELAFKRLRTVFAVSRSELNSCLNCLHSEGLLVKDRNKLSAAGVKALRAATSPALVKRTNDPIRTYRAYVSAALLGRSVDAQNLDVLSDASCLCAALSARLCNRHVELPMDDRAALINTAARVVIQSFLNDLSPKMSRSPIEPLEVAADPLLLDLFETASGHRTIETGFRVLAARALKTSLIPASDGCWRKISKAGFDSMAPSPLHQRQNLSDIATLLSVVDRVARATPTGWASVFKAFEAYREVNRLSLADFKLAVEAAARADKLELAPLNVPSLQNDNERAQSALVMGGLTYHLVRLPK